MRGTLRIINRQKVTKYEVSDMEQLVHYKLYGE